MPDELAQNLASNITINDDNTTTTADETPQNLQVVFNKSEREYVPYDLAKKYMEQLVAKIATQQSSYVVTIQKLENKYRKIELEANGHFTDFVTEIKSKYKLKIDTFKALMAVHKKELEKKQLEWDGGIKTLKTKNAHLTEQRKCLLLAYKSETKRITDEKDAIIRALQEENEKLRSQSGFGSTVVTIEKPQAEPKDQVDGPTATGISNDEVDELKRQIEDLKTQLASAEAGTTEQEQKVAEELTRHRTNMIINPERSNRKFIKFAYFRIYFSVNFGRNWCIIFISSQEAKNLNLVS